MLKQFLSFFDTFGVPLTLKLQSRELLFKSYFGGLLSLAIYSIALLYICYVFYLWDSDQIPPKMVTSRYLSSFDNLNLDGDIINVSQAAGNPVGLLDPFTQNENIITPVLLTSNLITNEQTFKSLLDDSIQPIIQQFGRTIEVKSGINKFLQNGTTTDYTYKAIMFIQCNQKFLSGNQTCASQERIIQYFQQKNNQLNIRLNKILLDENSRPVQNTESFYFSLEQQFCYTLNLDLKTNIYIVNKNLISQSSTKQEYISGSAFYGQTNSIEYVMNLFSGQKVYGSIFMSLQAQQTQITIQYPQMGELLASVGSILSILFLFRYLIYNINTYLLQKKVLEEVISYYYPEFKNINIRYNCFRQMKSATYKQEILNLDQFKKSYKQLMQKAEMKITFNNIIYEQSRLYLAMRSLKNQADLKKCHDYGINLGSSIQSTPYQSYRDSNVSYINTLTFDDKEGINKYFDNGLIFNSTYKTVLFIKCNQSYLSLNQRCAQEDKIKQYFSLGNNIITVQLIKILLDSQNQPSQSTTELDFYVEEQFSYFLNMDLKTNNYAVNKNLITSSFTQVEYLSDSNTYGQTNSIQLAQNIFGGLICYGQIYISLQAQQTSVTIQYPQMGELLAQIGSILSILFLFRYFIYSVNTYLLQRQVLEEVISYYYPEFKNIIIRYNFYRQITSATYKQEILNLDQFKKAYDQLIQKAEMKITFNNIIYEQSRLYLVMRSLKNQADLKKCHDYGINLGSSIQGTPYQSYRDSNVSYINNLTFDDNDFDLISLEQRKNHIEIINDEPPISNETVFRSGSCR